MNISSPTAPTALTGPAEPTGVPDPQDITDLAVAFISYLQDNVDWETVSPQDWRQRAIDAVTTAAAAGTRFSEVMVEACRKLQITATWPGSDPQLAALRDALADPDVFAAWQDTLRRDAVYLLPLTKMLRDARKSEKSASDKKAGRTTR